MTIKEKTVATAAKLNAEMIGSIEEKNAIAMLIAMNVRKLSVVTVELIREKNAKAMLNAICVKRLSVAMAELTLVKNATKKQTVLSA